MNSSTHLAWAPAVLAPPHGDEGGEAVVRRRPLRRTAGGEAYVGRVGAGGWKRRREVGGAAGEGKEVAPAGEAPVRGRGGWWTPRRRRCRTVAVARASVAPGQSTRLARMDREEKRE